MREQGSPPSSSSSSSRLRKVGGTVAVALEAALSGGVISWWSSRGLKMPAVIITQTVRSQIHVQHTYNTRNSNSIAGTNSLINSFTSKLEYAKKLPKHTTMSVLLYTLCADLKAVQRSHCQEQV